MVLGGLPYWRVRDYNARFGPIAQLGERRVRNAEVTAYADPEKIKNSNVDNALRHAV